MEKEGNIKTNKDLFIQKLKYLLSWVRRKVELNEVYFTQKIEDFGKPYALMGDIYYAYLGTNVGAEIDKERPVLIFQNNDRFLRQSNLVFVIPISSNMKINPYKVFIKLEDISENDNLKEGAILIQQSRSISKNRLIKYKGKLCNTKIEEVATELVKFLFKTNPRLLGGERTDHPYGCCEECKSIII